MEILSQSEQLRDLSQRLMQIQDEERRHVARELHDSAGQILAALAMNFASIAQPHTGEGSPIAAILKDSQELVHQLSQGSGLRLICCTRSCWMRAGFLPP